MHDWMNAPTAADYAYSAAVSASNRLRALEGRLDRIEATPEALLTSLKKDVEA